jgi:hypothetical protein
MQLALESVLIEKINNINITVRWNGYSIRIAAQLNILTFIFIRSIKYLTTCLLMFNVNYKR